MSRTDGPRISDLRFSVSSRVRRTASEIVHPHSEIGSRLWRLLLLSMALWLVGCSAGQMDYQPRCDPLEYSAFFDDGRCSRHPVDNTVARGQLQDDPLLYTGREPGQVPEESGVGAAGETEEQPPLEGGEASSQLATVYPFPITQEVLERGRERYNIYCTPCHSRDGAGDGLVVRRGYPQPPSFHIDRLREASPGYFYDVITNGIGVMPDYAGQIRVPDRWAIVAYLQVLQRSQNATLDDVPTDERPNLE